LKKINAKVFHLARDLIMNIEYVCITCCFGRIWSNNTNL